MVYNVISCNQVQIHDKLKRIKTGPKFWRVVFAIEAIIDITDALLPTIAQHFNLFQSFKAEANDGG